MRIFEILEDLSVMQGVTLLQSGEGAMLTLGMSQRKHSHLVMVGVSSPLAAYSRALRGELKVGTGPLWLVPEDGSDDQALVITRLRPGPLGALVWRGDPSEERPCPSNGRVQRVVRPVCCRTCKKLYEGSTGKWKHPYRTIPAKFSLPVIVEGRCSVLTNSGSYSWGEKAIVMDPGKKFEVLRTGALSPEEPKKILVSWDGQNLGVQV